MIDLNALSLYKEKISSYLDENALRISTKSNILNMFKIKNYTGNGIEPHGRVKIDENGIATGFREGNYILTGLSADILNTDNFEIQIKFKLSSLRPSNGAYYIWANELIYTLLFIRINLWVRLQYPTASHTLRRLNSLLVKIFNLNFHYKNR